MEETQQVRTIVVRAAGHIADYLPQGGDSIRVTVHGPRTMRDVLAEMGVPEGLVMAVITGGRRRSLSFVPEDGDDVTLVSPPAGG